jgi:AbiV family abortive infection protein
MTTPGPRRRPRFSEYGELNAAGLLADARTLSAAGRYPRAGALVVLALEELAKVPALFAAGVAVHGGARDVWPSFWRDYVNHTSKQRLISDYGRRLRDGDEFANGGPYASYLPDELGRILDIYKQRNFYVDFWNDSFILPGAGEEHPAGSVDQLHVLAEERSDSFERLHGTIRRSRSFFDWACRTADLVASGRESVPLIELTELLDPDHPDDVRRELHSLFAHRSSALIPDYLGTYALGGEIASLTSIDVLKAAMQDEADVLGRRIHLASSLPASSARAWAMYKLMLRLAENLGIDPPTPPPPPGSDRP